MKVIGRVGTSDYLISATVEEIAALSDRKITTTDNSSYYGRDVVVIGTTFNVNEAFSQIHRNDRRKGEVASIRQNLQAVITMLDMTEPFLEEPKTEAKGEASED